MISRGVLPEYRSTAVGAVTAASYLGSVAAFSASPYLIRTSNWDSVFLVFGALGVLFVPVWSLFPGQPLEQQRVPQGDGQGALAKEGGDGGAVGEARRGAELGAGIEFEVVLKEVREQLQRKEVLAIIVAQYTQSWGLYGSG